MDELNTRRHHPWAIVEITTAVNNIKEIKELASVIDLVIIQDGDLAKVVKIIEEVKNTKDE